MNNREARIRSLPGEAPASHPHPTLTLGLKPISNSTAPLPLPPRLSSWWTFPSISRAVQPYLITPPCALGAISDPDSPEVIAPRDIPHQPAVNPLVMSLPVQDGDGADMGMGGQQRVPPSETGGGGRVGCTWGVDGSTAPGAQQAAAASQ